MEKPKTVLKSGWQQALLLSAAILLLTWLSFLGLEGSRTSREARTVIGTINQQDISFLQFQNEVRFQELRQAMRQQENLPVNKAAILNRMVSDILLLQGAEEAGIEVSDEAVHAAIENVYQTYGISTSDFEAILIEKDIRFADFETSIRNYLKVLLFTEVEILGGVAAANRQAALQSWMTERFDASGTEFDPDFLDYVLENQSR